MKLLQDVFIVSARRTPIGAFMGGLASVPPVDLAIHVAKAALADAAIPPDAIGQAVFGQVIHTEPRDMYLARAVAVGAGLSPEVPALTLNRLCGSGLQAVISGVHAIVMDGAGAALVGGAESMSRAPHVTNALRAGQKMGDVGFLDMMVGALTDPFGNGHMGITAENVASRFGIDRQRQDALAVESHRRAALAQSEGRFVEQIAAVPVVAKRESVLLDRDEHIRSDASLDGMASLRPAFRKDGLVTAGNASGLNDGAASIILGDAATVLREGLVPRARIIGYTLAGVAPEIMGIGPIPAVTRLLRDTGLTVSDFDIIESNEAFAAQACAVADGLDLPLEKTNPNGGAIALGHPIGATGAILVVKALYELERVSGRRALVTMCIGGGQGIAMAFETVTQVNGK